VRERERERERERDTGIALQRNGHKLSGVASKTLHRKSSKPKKTSQKRPSSHTELEVSTETHTHTHTNTHTHTHTHTHTDAHTLPHVHTSVDALRRSARARTATTSGDPHSTSPPSRAALESNGRVRRMLRGTMPGRGAVGVRCSSVSAQRRRGARGEGGGLGAGGKGTTAMAAAVRALLMVLRMVSMSTAASSAAPSVRAVRYGVRAGTMRVRSCGTGIALSGRRVVAPAGPVPAGPSVEPVRDAAGRMCVRGGENWTAAIGGRLSWARKGIAPSACAAFSLAAPPPLLAGLDTVTIGGWICGKSE
jgi:hypothetical protein